MLSRPKGQQQSSADQPKKMFVSVPTQLEGCWRKYLGRKTRRLSLRERELALPLAEALARQADLELPICLREMIMHRQGWLVSQRKARWSRKMLVSKWGSKMLLNCSRWRCTAK